MITHARSRSTGSRLLQRTLRLDGIVCLLGGSAVAVTAGRVATLMGVSSALAVSGLGMVLAAYGAMLIMSARGGPIDRRIALGSTALDLLWVAGSIALLISDLLPLTNAGWWTVLLTMLGVTGMVEAKLWAWWRTR
ncbi:MAG TPA: hypothetical protein VEZ12_16490 [Herpetosiphonaceae bacterium]|jgi:hypothetical protein|nr:hypothetical protein [Herpetosiphonaceae bacterium]